MLIFSYLNVLERLCYITIATRLPPYPSPGDQLWENISRNISGDNLNIMGIVPVYYALGAEGAHAVAGADVAFILQDR